ncbi:MAG: gluconeogenesis factor YvcK family protein [Acidobacteriota bacterium]
MRRPGDGPRLVALGGGTGLSTLLRAAKRLPLGSLSAIVTVTDDGGSSGRLRREYAMPPPGDVRNCLVALAEDDELLTRLFAYRFPGEGDVGGHSLGNLFMTALHQITGDFPSAVRLAAEVLRVHGAVLPATGEDVHLVAEGSDGHLLVGETAITKAGPPRRLQLSPADPPALPEAAAAIRAADIVVLGPGSLFTSIAPNLLVPGLREALRHVEGPKVYIANLVTQPGETDGFDLARHVDELHAYAPDVEIDVILANSTPIPADVAAAYRASGADPIVPPDPWTGAGVLIRRPLLTVTSEGTVRHEPAHLAAALASLLGMAT